MNINVSDKLKLLVAFIVASAGLVFFYVLPNLPTLWRILAIGVAIISATAIFSLSEAGKALLAYIKSSIEEGKKIVWPTRQDSLRLTLLVFVFILLLSLFMWLIDSVLFWVFNDLLLRRG